MGGTLALYASRGVAVHLVCATRGEVGEVSKERLNGFNSIAELRESELRCAAGILGLAGVHYLDYRDSGMPGSPDNHHPNALVSQPLDEVAARVVCHIRTLKPQVVLTFDPIGGYRHPDHIAIHRATMRAFEQAANAEFAGECQPIHRPTSLYLHKMPNGLLKAAVRLLPFFVRDPHKFGANGDIDLVPSRSQQLRIDIRQCEDKRGSWRLPWPGRGRGGAGIARLLMRLFSSSEDFMRAYPPPGDGGKTTDDLFLSPGIK
jgi:LmbE family N-acetylglucosaminyl deacetylase